MIGRSFIIISILNAVTVVVPTAFPAKVWAATGAEVCMALTLGARTVTLPVASTFQSQLASRGYVVVPCSEAQVDAVSVNAMRDKVCQLASSAPDNVKANFAESYRVAPDELCAMMSAVTSE